MSKKNKSSLFFAGLFFAMGLFLTCSAERAFAANCICSSGSLVPGYYNNDAEFTTSDSDSCKQSCMNVGSNIKYFSFSNVAHVGFQQIYNCYCLSGSLIPFYFPNIKNLNTSDSDSCDQECANVNAKYFSFSNVAHIGTTLVTKVAIGTCKSSSGQIGTCEKPCAEGKTTTGNCTAAHGAMYANNDYSCCVGSTSASSTISSMNGGTMDSSIPGTTEPGGIIQCGRGGQNMCTLCDLIKGLNDIIQYIMKIAIGLALAMFTVGGGIYVISVGEPKMIEMGKGAMKNAAIGFAIIFSAWLIINTLLFAIGASSNLGISGVSSWGNFQCAAQIK